MKILKTTKIYDNRIYLPMEIREHLGLKEKTNGETIIFGLNNNHEIVLFKNKEEKKHDSRFKVKTAN